MYARSVRSTVLVALGIALGLGAGCNSSGGSGGADAGAAIQDAATELKEPVGLISAYLPYLLRPADDKEKYTPKRRPDLEKATICSANEIRHAANQARQKIGPAGLKDLEAALLAVATDCTDASEPEAADKCNAAVQKLDAELKKTADANPSAKIPRIGPEAITEDAKKRITPFLKAKGPSAAEKAYVVKRADAAASEDDVIAACQAAAEEADKAAKAFDKADEPIRLIAVTRKMSMDSQCGALTATGNLEKDVKDCRKKPKTIECKLACSKAKQRIEDGLPAAAFTPLEKDVADICKE